MVGEVPGVPTKDYARQHAALWPQLAPRLEELFAGGDAPILGAVVERFEQRFAAWCGVDHCVGVNSGTDALRLALEFCGVGAGDEVVVPAHTFVATVSAVVQCGARPVLVDVDPVSMLVTGEAVAAAVGPRTRAVLPVHLYGTLCDMVGIGEVCDAHRLTCIEDAAQAHGAEDAGGRRAGGFGHVGAFSFHPSKNLGAFGDAGALVTDDRELAERARVVRNLGKSGKHEVVAFGPNTKLDTIQALVLDLKLDHVDAWTARRRALAARYRQRLAGLEALTLPADGAPGRPCWHLFVVRCAERDRLRQHLADRGIASGMHYPIPPHLQPLPLDLGRLGEFPVTESIAASLLSLPLSHEHRDDEIDRVCDAVEEFFG